MAIEESIRKQNEDNAAKGKRGGKGHKGTPKSGKGTTGEGAKGGFPPKDPSTLHCYWFHHSTCEKPKGTCPYKHDKKITRKEKKELLTLGFAKRSSSEPPKKATSYAVGEDAKAKKRICNEFKKLGKCSKGDDCAYEHVAAAPESSKKDKRPPTGAIGAPAMFLEKEDSEECSVAACKDRRVTFPKLKTTAGGKKQD